MVVLLLGQSRSVPGGGACVVMGWRCRVAPQQGRETFWPDAVMGRCEDQAATGSSSEYHDAR
jgi:hypothetical protein